jgi:hypothetical protein
VPTSQQKVWNEYLAQTRNLVGARYEEVESWAWGQLCAKIGKPARQKGKVSAKKAA